MKSRRHDQAHMEGYVDTFRLVKEELSKSAQAQP